MKQTNFFIFLCLISVVLISRSDACKPSSRRRNKSATTTTTTTPAPSKKKVPCETIFKNEEERNNCIWRYLCGVKKIERAHLTAEEQLIMTTMNRHPYVIPPEIGLKQDLPIGLPEKVCDIYFKPCGTSLWSLRTRSSVM